MSDTVYVGLDLSLTGAGVAVLAPEQPLRSTTVKSKPTGPTVSQRCARLADHLQAIAAAVWGIDAADAQPFEDTQDVLVVLEAPSFASQHGSQHERAGLWWLTVSWALGPLGAQVVEVPPNTLKQFATGRGNADKDAVGFALAREFPHITSHPGNDEADAIWLATMGRYHGEGRDLAGVAPTAYRDKAVKAVSWR